MFRNRYIRKNPDVVWIKNKTDVIKNAKNQKKLIVKALSFFKKDGFLIYSNCSLQYEEGEYIIHDLVKQKMIKIDMINAKEISGYPKEIINKGLIRTLPYMYNGGMDGFFYSKIKKISNKMKRNINKPNIAASILSANFSILGKEVKILIKLAQTLFILM